MMRTALQSSSSVSLVPMQAQNLGALSSRIPGNIPIVSKLWSVLILPSFLYFESFVHCLIHDILSINRHNSRRDNVIHRKFIFRSCLTVSHSKRDRSDNSSWSIYVIHPFDPLRDLVRWMSVPEVCWRFLHPQTWTQSRPFNEIICSIKTGLKIDPDCVINDPMIVWFERVFPIPSQPSLLKASLSLEHLGNEELSNSYATKLRSTQQMKWFTQSSRVASEGVESPWFVLNEQRADRLLWNQGWFVSQAQARQMLQHKRLESSVPKITRLDDVTLTLLAQLSMLRLPPLEPLSNRGISYIDADRVRRRLLWVPHNGWTTTHSLRHFMWEAHPRQERQWHLEFLWFIRLIFQFT